MTPHQFFFSVSAPHLELAEKYALTVPRASPEKLKIQPLGKKQLLQLFRRSPRHGLISTPRHVARILAKLEKRFNALGEAVVFRPLLNERLSDLGASERADQYAVAHLESLGE